MKESFALTLCCPYPRRAFFAGEMSVEDELTEMERLLANAGDLVVFPEGFLSAENIKLAAEMVRASGKWVVAGAEEADRGFTVVVFSPKGELVSRHQKTALTDEDIKTGRPKGNCIKPFNSDFGIVGTPLCYEIHFPEISRVFAIKGAQILLNPIGTGMWSEPQLAQWTAVARARAIENGVYAAGCTHCCDAIPMAYAYAPDGSELGFMRDSNNSLTIAIDISALPPHDWKRHRMPELYTALCKQQ